MHQTTHQDQDLTARNLLNGYPRRLRLFLDAYGWDSSVGRFIDTVRHRVRASAEGIRRTAAAGDPAYQRMIEQGVDKALDTAVNELTEFPDT